MQPQFIEQRSDQWFLQRKARFTASEILNICESEQKLETAVYNKVYEAMMPDDVFLQIEQERNMFPAPPLSWGIRYEDEARLYFEQLTGKKVEQTGFFEYGRHSGGSSDGLILEDNGEIEIKCPYTGNVHLRFMQMKNQKELHDYSKYQAAGKQYYYQMQANMFFKKTDYCIFFSYDPRLREDYRSKILLIEPDKEVQQKIKDSIERASEMKVKLLNDLIKNARTKTNILSTKNNKRQSVLEG